MRTGCASISTQLFLCSSRYRQFQAQLQFQRNLWTYPFSALRCSMQRIPQVACSWQVPSPDWNPQLQLQVSCSSREPLGGSSWFPVVLSISVLWDSELCKKLDFPPNVSEILLLQLNPCANLKQIPHAAVNCFPAHTTFHIHVQINCWIGVSALPFTCTPHTDVSFPSLAVRKSLKKDDTG